MNLLSAFLLGAGAQMAETQVCDIITGAVREVERSWLVAYRDRDIAAMDEVLAEDFMITHPNGRLQTKAEVLRSIASRASERGPRFTTRGVGIRCRPGVAILSGWVFDEAEGEGRAARYTDTYVFTEGRWRVLASHLSRP